MKRGERMESGGAMSERLQQWLLAHWRDVDALTIDDAISRPEGSGYSATTMIVPVTVTRRGETGQQKIVVRMEPESESVYPVHCSAFPLQIEFQYRAIELLGRHSEVPVAPLIGLERNARVLGLPFFAMEYVDGQIPIEDPIYTSTGFFVDAAPDQRRSLLQRGLETLADIHRIDWRAARAEWLVDGGPDLRRDVRLWQRHGEQALAGRNHPAIEQAFRWLYDQLDSNRVDESEIVVAWGDARPGNIIWKDFECQCVCDFESMSLAPAASDVGWWLMFDRYAHDAQGIARLPGEPTRAEQRRYYEEVSGRELGDCFFYELFGAARYAILTVAVLNRWAAKGVLPGDHDIWLRNPVADMLLGMLDEI